MSSVGLLEMLALAQEQSNIDLDVLNWDHLNLLLSQNNGLMC